MADGMTVLAQALRELAAAVEKGSTPKFSVEDTDTREALEALFNTWYESAYSEVEEKVESLERSVSEHETKLGDIPENIGDHDFEDFDSRISDCERELKNLDTDAISSAVEMAKQLEDIDVSELSGVDFEELAEALAFYRRIKAHFEPKARRDAA